VKTHLLILLANACVVSISCCAAIILKPSARVQVPAPTQPQQEERTVSTMKEILETVAHTPIRKRAISDHRMLNEAWNYARPSSFSRGMRIDLNGLTILLISGTASIDENGRSKHIGDLRAQTRRTFSNITGLLASEGCTWHDIVRTSCYLRDIDRDYEAFNEERTAFYGEQGLDPLPASTGIQAKLCRPELLVEIEAIAMFQTEKQPVDPHE
jgi:2-iminobutanoate/2-iminopropanoate deaminase